MMKIFFMQWLKFVRSPYVVLIMMALTLIMVFLFGFRVSSSKDSIPTYADASLAPEQRNAMLEKLNHSEWFEFIWREEATTRQELSEGRVELALKLQENNYVIVSTVKDNPNLQAVNNHVAQVYTEELQLRAAEQQVQDSQFRRDVETSLTNPVLRLTQSSPEGEVRSFHNDTNLQLLFGMTLFFVINTITLSTSEILVERRTRTWDRIILSPIRKWEVYTGHLAYSFAIGFVQILLIFLLFHFAFGIDLSGQFGTILVITACYVFAIAALSVLLAGLITTPEAFYVIVPNIAAGIAMLGGAYWPLEIITHPILLALSKIMPISYAMEALKGAVISNQGIAELATPLSILLLFGVLCMGVGINIMERRHTA